MWMLHHVPALLRDPTLLLAGLSSQNMGAGCFHKPVWQFPDAVSGARAG